MKTLTLNIMASYPVFWSKQQVLRDIVQNFYDDIGAFGFAEKFKTMYEPATGQVMLSSASDGFSYEWLLHLGASTKQAQPGKYAGFFGEGFKMAALCALRDHKWKITMRSRDWEIKVCIIGMDIDGRTMQQLAYNVDEELDYLNETLLVTGVVASKSASHPRQRISRR